MTYTQQIVLDALGAVQAHDLKAHGRVYHRPQRVATAAGISYDRARRALGQLHLLGLVKKLDAAEEYGVGTDLYYAPAWSHDREDAPSGWMSEWDMMMSMGPDGHLSGSRRRLEDEDDRLREKHRK